jgi:hypothetical protein
VSKGKGRKDARNREIESGHWKPHQWREATVRAKVRHAHRWTLHQLEFILGTEEGRALATQLQAAYKEQLSVAALRARGVKLVGDA